VVESKAWIWTSAFRGPRQQLLGDAIKKRGLKDHVWVGYAALRTEEDDDEGVLEPAGLKDLLIQSSVKLAGPDGPLPEVSVRH
jgi:hypothetical protein